MRSPETDATEPNSRIVYVIDDDGDLRRSLHFLLQTSGIYVSPFASGIDFLSELPNLSPAPILLDIRMPRMDGNQVLFELSSRKINWPVVVISGHGDVATAVKSLKLGAVDFLEKPAPASELLHAIEIAFGNLAVMKEVDSARRKAVERFACLTPREIEVIELLCDGRSNKQVAFDLSISPRTVEMHRANALRQLGVRTLVEAVALRNAGET